MADWSLLQQPDFAKAALGGYQAGRQIAQERATQAALSSVDLERPETLYPLLRNPDTLQTGVALIGAATKAAQYKHELAGKAAHADLLEAQYKAANPPAASSVTSPVPTTPPVAAAAVDGSAIPAASNSAVDPDTITVTAQNPPAPSPQDTLRAAKLAYMRMDPDGYEASEKNQDTHNDNAIKFAKGRLDMESQLLGTVKDQASYATAKAQAAQMGIDVSNLPQNYDPQIVNNLVQSTLTAKDRLDQVDKDRTFAETQKQHGIENGLSAQRVGLETQNVGIAGGHLALDRQKEAREAGKAGAGSAVTRTIGGKTYYNVGGKWFDNPGGN